MTNVAREPRLLSTDQPTGSRGNALTTTRTRPALTVVDGGRAPTTSRDVVDALGRPHDFARSAHSAFLVRREQYRVALGTHLAALAPLYVLTEMPGNVGDHLISEGVRHLLHSVQLPFGEIAVSAIDGETKMEGTLLVPGSGAFHRLWHEWLPATVQRAARMFDRVEIMPSSFDPSLATVARALSMENVFCFARDPLSYRAIAPFGRAVLAPDAVIFHEAFDRPPAIRQETGDNVLVALRTDAGSPFHGTDWVPHPVHNNDVSVSASNVSSFLAAITAVETVVTDRLHVAVAGVLRGRRVHYVDPYDQKISSTLAVALRSVFSHSISDVTREWLARREYIVGVTRP